MDAFWAACSASTFRRTLAAQGSLFSIGDRCHAYYFVESGELLVHRARSKRAQPAVRLICDGDLVAYDCDGVRAASCVALVDCSVICLDRQKLLGLSAASPQLHRLVQAMHSAELEMILESLRSEPVRRLPRDIAETAPTFALSQCIALLRRRVVGVVPGRRAVACVGASVQREDTVITPDFTSWYSGRRVHVDA